MLNLLKMKRFKSNSKINAKMSGILRISIMRGWEKACRANVSKFVV